MESDPVRYPDLESGQFVGQRGLGTQCQDTCGGDALTLERQRGVQENGVGTPL